MKIARFICRITPRNDGFQGCGSLLKSYPREIGIAAKLS
jgi:hypothetical protein